MRSMAARLTVLAAIVVAGCGYRLTSSPQGRMPAGRTVWVTFPRNETISQSAQTTVRRTLYEELHAARGLTSAADVHSADFQLSGRIVSYASRIISYTASDQAREYRLTTEVELEVRRNGEAAPLWKGILQASADFPAHSDLALQRNAEEAALSALSRSIAGRLVAALEQAY